MSHRNNPKRNGWRLVACCVVLALLGCDSGSGRSGAPANGPRPADLVGKWHLVRAGGQPPSDVWIKSLDLDLAADGTWKSAIEGTGQYLDGMTVKGAGTWSLADGVLSYTLDGPGNPKGADTVNSRVRLESGRLVLDPDHFMQIRKKGPDLTGEYTR